MSSFQGTYVKPAAALAAERARRGYTSRRTGSLSRAPGLSRPPASVRVSLSAHACTLTVHLVTGRLGDYTGGSVAWLGFPGGTGVEGCFLPVVISARAAFSIY